MAPSTPEVPLVPLVPEDPEVIVTSLVPTFPLVSTTSTVSSVGFEGKEVKFNREPDIPPTAFRFVVVDMDPVTSKLLSNLNAIDNIF